MAKMRSLVMDSRIVQMGLGGLLLLSAVLIWAIATNAAGNAPISTPGASQPTVAAENIGGTIAPAGSKILPNGSPVQSNASTATSMDMGIPAIRPTLSTIDPRTPAFSTQDAEQYVAMHPTMGKISTVGKTTIVSTLFLSGAQYKAQVSASNSLSDDRLLCVVQQRGTFTLSAPPLRQISGTVVVNDFTYHTVIDVFDARTGNFLEERIS